MRMNGLTVFEKGEIVWLDFDLSNKSEVEVISQSPQLLFTLVKTPNGATQWEVMTYRLSRKL